MQKQQFITLEVRQVGFVVYGIGPGARNVNYRGEVLDDFLEKLWERMLVLKGELNQAWNLLDKQNTENPANLPSVQKLLAVGSWAYAQTLDLLPFSKNCSNRLTDSLQFLFLRRLEEIYTKCFAAAHLYGQPDERMIGLRGLLTDFEANGGVNHKDDNKEGAGFHISMLTYYMAYLNPTNHEPEVYQRFGELMMAIAELIAKKYPNLVTPFVRQIETFSNEPMYFGSPEVQSSAKTEMLVNFSRIKASFAPAIEKAA